MAIVRPESLVYRITSGENKGKSCVIRGEKEGDSESVLVVFIHNEKEFNTLVAVKKGELALLDTPGWPEWVHQRPYSFADYEQNKGNGTCMLHTVTLSQPRALIVREMLATGESVVEAPRVGYNSTPLIKLDLSGWVEIAARLPIALLGNKEYRLPGELVKGDVLATGCVVVKDLALSDLSEINWTCIALDNESCRIGVPSCIPLALKA